MRTRPYRSWVLAMPPSSALGGKIVARCGQPVNLLPRLRIARAIRSKLPALGSERLVAINGQPDAVE
jgi:hypothetical protein